MREKLKELSEILKQNTAIKERLEKIELGCYLKSKIYTRVTGKEYYLVKDVYDGEYFIKNTGGDIDILGNIPQYSDILEYLGDDYAMDCKGLYWEYNVFDQVRLSPGPLSGQTDSTLDEIISLCKNVGMKNG